MDLDQMRPHGVVLPQAHAISAEHRAFTRRDGPSRLFPECPILFNTFKSRLVGILLIIKGLATL